MNTNVDLNKMSYIDFLKIQNLQTCVYDAGEDGCYIKRGVDISKVLYDSELKKLFALDGIMYREEQCDLSYCGITENSRFNIYENEVFCEDDEIPVNYRELYSVINSLLCESDVKYSKIPLILNRTMLELFLSTIPKNKNVQFVQNTPKGMVLTYLVSEYKEPVFIGGVMPTNIFTCNNKFEIEVQE
jgi:hypothetical protein